MSEQDSAPQDAAYWATDGIPYSVAGSIEGACAWWLKTNVERLVSSSFRATGSAVQVAL